MTLRLEMSTMSILEVFCRQRGRPLGRDSNLVVNVSTPRAMPARLVGEAVGNAKMSGCRWVHQYFSPDGIC